MPGILLKKRPLSRYLKDYKHSQTHCSQCGKLLDRMALVFRGKIINKEAIARMDQPIDDAVWQNVQHELTALCRFCSEISCNSHPSYFDIMAFKQYLFEQTEMSHSTIREYVVAAPAGRNAGGAQLPGGQVRQQRQPSAHHRRSAYRGAQQLPHCAAQIRSVSRLAAQLLRLFPGRWAGACCFPVIKDDYSVHI